MPRSMPFTSKQGGRGGPAPGEKNKVNFQDGVAESLVCYAQDTDVDTCDIPANPPYTAYIHSGNLLQTVAPDLSQIYPRGYRYTW